MNLGNLVQAIAQEEQGLLNGQINPNTVGMSANNPINLEMGDIGYGTVTAAGGQELTIFPSLQAGYQAATNMVQSDVSGNSSIYSPNMSLQQYMQTFTGGSATAGNTVASILGVPSSTPISSFGQIAGSVQPNAASTTAPGTASTSSTGSPAWLAALKALLGPLGTFLPGSGQPGIVDIVAILAGLILIAGMVFGFRQLAVTIKQGVQAGVETAA